MLPSPLDFFSQKADYSFLKHWIMAKNILTVYLHEENEQKQKQRSLTQERPTREAHTLPA